MNHVWESVDRSGTEGRVGSTLVVFGAPGLSGWIGLGLLARVPRP